MSEELIKKVNRELSQYITQKTERLIESLKARGHVFDSFENAIEVLDKTATPLYAMMYVKDDNLKNKLQNYTDLTFEFCFLRLRSNKGWILIKGDKKNTVSEGQMEELCGASPKVLFDIFGHNHPNQNKAIESANDIYIAYSLDIEDSIVCLIVGKDGITEFSVSALTVDIDSFMMAPDVLLKEAKHRAARAHPEEANKLLGLDISIAPNNPFVRDQLVAILEEKGIKTRFKDFNKSREEKYFETKKLELARLLQSPKEDVASKAVNLLADIYTPGENDINLADVFCAFAQHPNELIQYDICINFGFIEKRRNKKILEAFTRSSSPLGRRMAATYLREEEETIQRKLLIKPRVDI